jgi:hypothetical protein
MEGTNLKDLLYGKSLQSLVTSALISLEAKKTSNDILIKTVISEIIIKRPELEEIINNGKEKQHLTVRVHNCVKQLDKTNLVEIQRKKTKNIDYHYIIIIPKLL